MLIMPCHAMPWAGVAWGALGGGLVGLEQKEASEGCSLARSLTLHLVSPEPTHPRPRSSNVAAAAASRLRAWTRRGDAAEVPGDLPVGIWPCRALLRLGSLAGQGRTRLGESTSWSGRRTRCPAAACRPYDTMACRRAWARLTSFNLLDSLAVNIGEYLSPSCRSTSQSGSKSRLNRTFRRSGRCPSSTITGPQTGTFLSSPSQESK